MIIPLPQPPPVESGGPFRLWLEQLHRLLLAFNNRVEAKTLTDLADATVSHAADNFVVSDGTSWVHKTSTEAAAILDSLIAHSGLSGLTGDAHADLIFDAPVEAGRNLIQPAAANAYALVLKNHASQSVDIFQARNSSGTVLAKISSAGKITAKGFDADTTIVSGVADSSTGQRHAIPRVQLEGTAGAGMVGLLDSGGKTSETTVEGALSEIYDKVTSEAIQDIVGAMFTSNTETRCTVSYEDGDGTIDVVVDDMTANTQLTQEQVEDYVGGMLDGDETFITVAYDDTDGNIDFTVPVKDEDAMGSDSATHLSTQQSIKAYVDSKSPSRVWSQWIPWTASHVGDTGSGTIGDKSVSVASSTDYDGATAITNISGNKESQYISFIVDAGVDVSSNITLTAYYKLSGAPGSTQTNVQWAIRSVADNESTSGGGTLSTGNATKDVSGHSSGDLVIHSLGNLFTSGQTASGDFVKGSVYVDDSGSDGNHTYGGTVQWIGVLVTGTRALA